MRQYTIFEEQEKKVTRIICNKCKREIEVVNGIPREDVFSAEKRWGYFSQKDNEIHRFDLGESCYDEWVKSFGIPVEIE